MVVSCSLYNVGCVMMNSATAAGLGVVFVVLLLLFRWKWRALKQHESETECPPCTPVQLVHRLCPHHNVVQRFQVEEKDSLDEHLDVLTRKLAEKEGRLRLSKSKIRETQNEIENLHAIDHDVRIKYREIMESLRSDLLCNEKECKKLQEQIEWVSRRRAELKDEVEKRMAVQDQFAEQLKKWKINEKLADFYKLYYVRRGQRLYGEAAAELASNLAELQRGRVPEQRVTDKPLSQYSSSSLRLRKEPLLPRISPANSITIKNSPPMSPPVMSRAET